MIYRKFVKRLLDFILALIALFFTWPLLLTLVILIRIKLGSPVFFRQIRPGLNGKPFKLYKFRTMNDERDSKGELLSDDRRLTSFGRFIRSTSLDELPQLWNMLKGDMSLVGPRPLLMQYLERYTPEQNRRHDVKPGMTGWAQVNGRNAISWQERFKLDAWYANNISFWLDVKIILLTVEAVVSRRDISSSGCATIDEFMGSN